MWWQRALFQRRNGPTLVDVLAADAQATAAESLEFSVSPLGQLARRGGAALLLVVAIGAVSFGGSPSTGQLVLAAVGLCAMGAEALVSLLSTTSRVRVWDGGIEADRPSGHFAIPWWDVTAVWIRGDLARVRIATPRGFRRLKLDVLSPHQRLQVATAIRRHTMERGIDLQPLPRWDLTFSDIALTATMVVLAAFGLLAHLSLLQLSYGALGMRCSGPSAYMRERYDLPNRPGCVVLRSAGNAKQAGIRQGDLLIGWDGSDITSGPDFAYKWERSRGREHMATVIHPGERTAVELRIELAGWSTPPFDKSDPMHHFANARRDGVNDPARAIPEYTRAIELAPDFDLAYVYRGSLLLDQGRDEEALADLLRAIELNPDLPEAHLQLGAYYMFNHTLIIPRTARAEVLRAIELDHCDTRAIRGEDFDCATDYALLAALYTQTQPADVAIDAARRAVGFAPSLDYARFILVSAYYQHARWQEAITAAEEYFDLPAVDRRSDRDSEVRDMIRESRKYLPQSAAQER